MRYWIFFCLLVLSSCQNNVSSNQKQVLRINIENEPRTLDPRKARILNDLTLLHMFFEGLTRIGKNGVVEPALAERVEISEDGCFYTFHLRKALWSDGMPVTSYDFAHSWRTTLAPAFPADLAYQLFVVKGAKAAKLGESSLEQVALQTPDERTLVVELEQPTPYFLELLTFPAFFPVQRHLDLNHPKWSEDPSSYISNGPFLLKKWQHADSLQVVRNETYWDVKNVKLQELELIMVSPEAELRLFKDGKLDWAGSPLSSMPVDALAQLHQKQELRISPLSGTYFLRVNTTDASPLSHPLFRKSVALAIDRQKITEHILQGGQMAAKSLVPPAMGLSEDGYFSDADENEARDELKSFLEETGMKLEDISSIALLYQANERNHAIAQALQQEIEGTLGIRIQLEAVDGKTLYERLAKKHYQLAAGSWIADFNDPINFLEVFKFKNSGTNHTGWENRKYIERLELSAVCRNPEKRKTFLQEAEELLMEEMPLIPIYHFALNYLQRPEIEDVALSPIGQIDFRWSHIEKNLR